jgi:hypothetical protein
MAYNIAKGQTTDEEGHVSTGILYGWEDDIIAE